MSEIMETSFGGKFDELRARHVNTPERAARYERTVRTVVLIRKLLMAIDEERQRAAMPKAELARRIGHNPSVVRRIFSKESSNPTLKTVLDMLTALNIDVELRPAQQPPAPTSEKSDRKPRRRSTRAKAAA